MNLARVVFLALSLSSVFAANVLAQSCPGGPTTCPGGATTCFLRTGNDIFRSGQEPFPPGTATNSRCVRFIRDSLIIDFDTAFGSTPLDWYTGGSPFSFMSPGPAAGTGFQVTYDTGQDGTQAGFNGVTPFFVAREIDNDPYHAYYMREDVPSGWPSGATSYTIRGHLPDFWISHEAPDDAVPPISVGTPQDGWMTKYSPAGKPVSVFTGFGTPVFFKGTSNQTEGYFFVGDTLAYVPTDNPPPWNQRLREIEQGVFAFKTQVHLQNTGGSPEAGLVFRAEIDDTAANATLATVIASQRYLLVVNKSGVVTLKYFDGLGNVTQLWQAYDPAWDTQVEDPLGLRLEVRTDIDSPDEFEVYVDSQFAVRCPSTSCSGYLNTIDGPIGEHFGLYASAAVGAELQFSDRGLFDMSLEFSLTATSVSGGIEVLAKAANIPAITSNRTIKRFNMAAYLNDLTAPDLSWFWTTTSQGQLINPPACNIDYLPNIGSAPNPVSSIWTGRLNGTLGLHAYNIQATQCTGSGGSKVCVPSTTSKARIAGLPSPILHLNVTNDDVPPLSVTEVSLKARFKTTIGPKTPVTLGAVPLNYFGSCASETTVFRPANNAFYINNASGVNSSRPEFFQLGSSNSLPIHGEFDGDGKVDYGVVTRNAGYLDWKIKLSSNGSLFQQYPWGLAGDYIAVGDYNKSGRDDLAVWRPSTGYWYINQDSGSLFNRAYQPPFQFGLSGDVPLSADFDGDDQDDFAVWRPANGTWYWAQSSNNNQTIAVQWGLNGDVPVSGDYFFFTGTGNQDNQDDYGVWRPSSGTWYLRSSANPSWIDVKQWGLSGDIPVPISLYQLPPYPRDSILDLGVFRTVGGYTYWFGNLRGGLGGTLTQQWGLAGDKFPVRVGQP